MGGGMHDRGQALLVGRHAHGDPLARHLVGRAGHADGDLGVGVAIGCLERAEHRVATDGGTLERGIVVDESEDLPTGFDPVDRLDAGGDLAAEAAGAYQEEGRGPHRTRPSACPPVCPAFRPVRQAPFSISTLLPVVLWPVGLRHRTQVDRPSCPHAECELPP